MILSLIRNIIDETLIIEEYNILQKEQGYNEFLAEKIAKGRADFISGRYSSLDDALAYWQHSIEQNAVEMALLNEELKKELSYA